MLNKAVSNAGDRHMSSANLLGFTRLVRLLLYATLCLLQEDVDYEPLQTEMKQDTVWCVAVLK